MTDASFGAAGYAVLIEDDPNQKFTSIRKSYALVAYGSKTSTPEQIKMSIYAKKLFRFVSHSKNSGIFLGCPETGHYPNRQQNHDQIFPNENCIPIPVERL